MVVRRPERSVDNNRSSREQTPQRRPRLPPDRRIITAGMSVSRKCQSTSCTASGSSSPTSRGTCADSGDPYEVREQGTVNYWRNQLPLILPLKFCHVQGSPLLCQRKGFSSTSFSRLLVPSVTPSSLDVRSVSPVAPCLVHSPPALTILGPPT